MIRLAYFLILLLTSLNLGASYQGFSQGEDPQESGIFPFEGFDQEAPPVGGSAGVYGQEGMRVPKRPTSEPAPISGDPAGRLRSASGRRILTPPGSYPKDQSPAAAKVTQQGGYYSFPPPSPKGGTLDTSGDVRPLTSSYSATDLGSDEVLRNSADTPQPPKSQLVFARQDQRATEHTPLAPKNHAAPDPEAPCWYYLCGCCCRPYSAP